MKIAAYMRVSTKDKQKTDSQRESILNWTKTNHIKPSALVWYADKMSGTISKRPELDRAMRDIDNGKINCLVCFRLDRLARSTIQGLKLLATLGEKGIRVVSVSENIDFSSTTGKLIASILLSVASWEREVIVERIKAGLKATKKEIGRPRNNERLKQIRKLHDSGMKVSDIADKLKCSRQNVYLALSRTEGLKIAK